MDLGRGAQIEAAAQAATIPKPVAERDGMPEAECAAANERLYETTLEMVQLTMPHEYIGPMATRG